MSMTHPPIAALQSLSKVPGASLVEGAEHLELSVTHGTILVVVTVPDEVLEWFVDASDETCGRKVSDWCDYTGYEDTPPEQLAVDMAGDVSAFAQSLLSRHLRFAERHGLFRSKAALEWKVDGVWEQAVPLTAKFAA